MKNILCSLLLLLGFYQIQAQQEENPMYPAVANPDSILEITTVLPGTSEAQKVTVEVKNGWAKMEGDIVLGRIEDLQRQSAQDRGVVIENSYYRWPGGAIPYEISLPGINFTPQYLALIQASIDYINSSTHLLLYPSVSATDRILVVPAKECSSQVGRIGGIQTLQLMDTYANGGAGCDFSAIIHEFAHAAGAWHEQSREDRDNYISVKWANINPVQVHNFNKHVSDGIDLGPYDFNSVMHYGPYAFSFNGQPTITALAGQSFGNATEYSVGDVATINWMYPVNNCAISMDLWASIPSVASPLLFETMWAINSTAVIPAGSNVTYDGGIGVVLKPGFVAKEGTTFHAVVEGCGGFYTQRTPPEVEEWILEAERAKPGQAAQQGAPVTKPSGSETGHANLSVSPNPFTDVTTIAYDLPLAQQVEIEVLNALGGRVAQPVPQVYQAQGRHEYAFEADNLPPGVYFFVLHTGGQKQTKRVVLNR